jgi:hypothetical protein
MTFRTFNFTYNQSLEWARGIEIVGLLTKKLKPDIILRIIEAIKFKIFDLSSLSV